jgi:hypothetical protein
MWRDIYIGEAGWQKPWWYFDTIMSTLLTLATLGKTAQIEAILFVLYHPRCLSLVVVAQTQCNITDNGTAGFEKCKQ